MDNLNRKAGFLEGLLAEMDESKDPQATRILHAIGDLLTALTERVCSHDVLLSDLNDYVESIDDDLAALEGEDTYRFDSKGEIGTADIVPFSRESDPDELIEEEDEEFDEEHDQIETYAGRVCPHCNSIFLVSAEDDPTAKYQCPSCSHIIAPLLLTPETAQPVRPVE